MKEDFFEPNGSFANSLVMIVDDCNTDNYVNSKIINYYRFSNKIVVYTDPTKALQKLKEMDSNHINNDEIIPSFIFLDLNMPHMNGHTFIQEFGKLSINFQQICKIVVLSNTFRWLHRRIYSMSDNVVSVLSKPLIKSNLEELSVLVKKNENKVMKLVLK